MSHNITKVLSIDASTKTGFAILERDDETGAVVLKSYGLLTLGKKINDFGVYPWSYIYAAREMAKNITDLVEKERPDVVIVEETNLGRQRYTQKILEFLHNALLTRLSESFQGLPVFYLSTSEWRSALDLRLSKEDKKANRKLSAAKKMAEMMGQKLDKKTVGVKGKKTWKHLSVEHVNARFGTDFKVKHNDISDAINLGLAFIAGARPCTGND